MSTTRLDCWSVTAKGARNATECKGLHEHKRKCNQQLAKVSGSMFQEGLERPELPA